MLGTVALAVPALVALGGDEVLPSLVEGTRTAALAVPDHGGRFDPALVSVTESGGALTGEATQVVDGTADVLLVAARAGSGLGLYVVEGGERRSLSTLDRTRRQAAVRFSATPARLVASGADAERAITAALRVGGALLAAEQVGGAQRLLDLTVAYAGTRLQFGRADRVVPGRQAPVRRHAGTRRARAVHGATTPRGSLQDGTDDPQLARIAQATCSEAYQRVAADTVQLHGGIGFTWEHPAHLYLKRAVTDAALLGSAAAHRERIAQLVLDTAVASGTLAVATG